ncbi:MAG: hypothetical protein MR436_04010 [Eubacterium sp.]|nr:hypothetical protein [Eubacterium sp.]
MEWLYEWFWVIPVIIGIVSAVKIVTLVKSRTTYRNNTERFTVPIINTSRSTATETGQIIYYANDRHNQRDKEYRFNYKKIGGSWRAYILRMPSLGNRDSSGAVTHRLFDNGRPYVCWDSDVKTLKDMQTISRVWADSIQEYIATGKRFG